MSNATTRAAAEVLQSLASCKKQKTHDSGVIDLTGPNDSAPRAGLTIDSDDNEVQIVDPPPRATPVKTDAHNKPNGDDDVEVMGTVNSVRLPHMRCHCTEYPFVENQKENNGQTCDLCYCYVCDVPVKECKEWKASHCDATDKGPRAYYWNSLRQNTQTSKTTETVLEARLDHGKLFKSIFQTVGKFVNQVCLDCCPRYGISCDVRSDDMMTLVSWELKTAVFDNFQCNDQVLLHVNVSHVNEALKAVKKKTHVVVLEATGSFLSISIEDKSTGEVVSDVTRVSLCRNQRYVPLGRPSQRHKCDARIASADFKRIIGQLWNVASATTCIIVPLSSGPDSISFSMPDDHSASKGCISKCRYTLKLGDHCDGAGVVMNGSDPFEVQFSTRLLYQLTRPPPLSRNVFLAFSPGLPMEVEYQLEDPANKTSLGRFSLIVPPRFDNEASALE